MRFSAASPAVVKLRRIQIDHGQLLALGPVILRVPPLRPLAAARQLVERAHHISGVKIIRLDPRVSRHRPGGRRHFVTAQGKSVGTTFDARRQATVLNLLDAAHLEDGPIAQAVLPYALPLGFHGNWMPAV